MNLMFIERFYHMCRLGGLKQRLMIFACRELMSGRRCGSLAQSLTSPSYQLYCELSFNSGIRDM
jgi:hypothetical protein